MARIWHKNRGKIAKIFEFSVGSNYFGEGKPTSNPPNSGFEGTNPSPTTGEVGSIGGKSGSIGNDRWFRLAGSLDSPRLRNHGLDVIIIAMLMSRLEWSQNLELVLNATFCLSKL